MAAGTTTPSVTRAGWTLVSAAATSGKFQNISGNDILIREQTADPGADEKAGVVYHPYAGDTYIDTLGLWARQAPGAGAETASPIAVVEW